MTAVAGPTARRPGGYAATLLTGLAAAALVTLGASRPWVTATARVDGLPVIKGSASGADVAPLAAALGFVLLAGFGAVVATRGRWRQAVGGSILVASVVVLLAALLPGQSTDAIEADLSAHGWAGGDYSSHAVAWRWLVVAGAVLCAAAGAAVLRWGARWATMGARYDPPAGGSAADDVAATELTSEPDLWKAIDRGHDPTQQP